MAKGKKQDKKVVGETKALVAVNEILKGESEDETLKRHRIEPEAFDKLLNNPKFVLQVSNRIGLSIIRTKLLIAQYAQTATAKLIQLTDCDKEETARKACLDVITLATKQSEATIQKEKVSQIIEDANTPTELTEDQASKMLALLAEDDGQGE